MRIHSVTFLSPLKRIEKKSLNNIRDVSLVPLHDSHSCCLGRVLASISSRPGQCGRSDGYVLEGKELEFYLRKIKAKKGK